MAFSVVRFFSAITPSTAETFSRITKACRTNFSSSMRFHNAAGNQQQAKPPLSLADIYKIVKSAASNPITAADIADYFNSGGTRPDILPKEVKEEWVASKLLTWDVKPTQKFSTFIPLYARSNFRTLEEFLSAVASSSPAPGN
jgi:hypothetical protein